MDLIVDMKGFFCVLCCSVKHFSDENAAHPEW